MKDTLAVGLTTTRRVAIDKQRTIDFMGDELRVYATPWMARDIEVTCRDLILENLDDGEDTVDSSHPTDLGFMRQATAFRKALDPILNPGE